MKHTIVFGVVLILYSLLVGLTSHAYAFSDAGQSQYAQSIDALEARGLVKGYSDGTFRPFSPINRAEFLKLAMDAKDIAVDSSSGNCFSDVHQEWFAAYVCKAVDLGYVKGYPDGTFQPGKSINMVEAQKIVSLVFNLSVREKSASEEWFVPYVEFYHNNTFFSKYAYHPGKDFRREEMAFAINELLLNAEGKRPLTFVRNAYSTGCGKRPPATPPSSFHVDGMDKQAIVSVPLGYDSSKPLSLIFAFHGRTSSNERVRSYYGLDRVTAGSAIIVYPAGNQTGSTYNWNGGERFFDVMLWEMKQQYCIDTDKVYAVGHSLGAVFVNDLACTRSELLRGVGTLGGSTNKRSCNGPVAAIVFHNPKDNLVPFSGGEGARDRYLRQNNASTQTKASEPAWGNCVEYLYGHSTSPVVWCPHAIDTERDGTYYPHVWPRETGAAIWSFFKGLPN